jgi:hypothetical protein
MTPILTRLARDIDDALGGSVCQDAIRDASNGGADLSLVHWRFLAGVLRAMTPAADKVQAVIDPVIAGMDKLGRGERWPKAKGWGTEKAARRMRARAAQLEDMAAAWTADAAAEAAWAPAWAKEAAAWATSAAVTRARQRDILLRLIKEASA